MSAQNTETQHSSANAQQDGRLRQAQFKMLAMLKVVDAICSKHHLDYWLDGGTLLGAIRHQGFIPWDDDLDISMPRASYERFLQVAPAEIPESMHLQTAQTEVGYFNLRVPLKIRDLNSRFIEWHEQVNESWQQGIFIDVFVYDSMPASPLRRWFYKLVAKKVLRVLCPKYSSLVMGHRARLYQLISWLFPKKMLENRLQKIIRKANSGNSMYMGCGYDGVNSSLLTRDDIYPLKSCQFEGHSFLVPHRAEVILKQLYNDWMTLPPENQRVMKHCKELIPHYPELQEL